jgi:hypothetical protein
MPEQTTSVHFFRARQLPLFTSSVPANKGGDENGNLENSRKAVEHWILAGKWSMNLGAAQIPLGIKVRSLKKTLHPGANLYASRTGGSPRLFRVNRRRLNFR